MNESSHVAFGDESGIHDPAKGAGIGLLSLERSSAITLHRRMKRLFNKPGLSKFKWHGINSEGKVDIAFSAFDMAFKLALEKQLRVDVLLWHGKDERHRNVTGRDDVKNMNIMYYHLCKNVFMNRWSDDSTWKVVVDQNTAINWKKFRYFLEKQSVEYPLQRCFDDNETRCLEKIRFTIKDIDEVESKKQPLVRLSDLFVGMAVFSFREYQKYQSWLMDKSGQRTLFEEERTPISNVIKHKFTTLSRFHELCCNCKMGVSLDSSRCLSTRNGKNPINFWWWKAQHSRDRAPTRSDKRDNG